MKKGKRCLSQITDSENALVKSILIKASLQPTDDYLVQSETGEPPPV